MQAPKEDDSGDDMSDSNDEEEGNPVMHLRQVALSCGVNRVRAMPQQPGVVASWGDNGQVSVSSSNFSHRGSSDPAIPSCSDRERAQSQGPIFLHILPWHICPWRLCLYPCCCP